MSSKVNETGDIVAYDRACTRKDHDTIHCQSQNYSCLLKAIVHPSVLFICQKNPFFTCICVFYVLSPDMVCIKVFFFQFVKSGAPVLLLLLCGCTYMSMLSYPVADICDNVDQDEDCEFWESTGECFHNPPYMLVNCRKSCGLCANATGQCLPLLNSLSIPFSVDFCHCKKPFAGCSTF